MKKYIRIIPITIIIMAILYSCDKKDTALTPPGHAKCRLTQVSSTFNSQYGSSTYEYSSDGKLIAINYYSRNSLETATTLGEFFVESKYTSSSGFPMIQTTNFKGGSIFADQLPAEEDISLTEGAVTTTDIWSYYFYYDNKDRLIKVSEETKHYVGDWEYDLFISYNDQDNVTSLKYVNTTGPNTFTIIPATGYDDKPSPYSGLRTWKYLVSWNASDPTALFAQLSKNNPLGFIEGDWTRKMTYDYNENGYPTIRNNVQTVKNSTDTARWLETFDYDCK
jgi:hypothetical protein